MAPQNVREEYLLTENGATNEGMRSQDCRAEDVPGLPCAVGFAAISSDGCQIYGPGDNFDRKALTWCLRCAEICEDADRKRAEIVIWGSGSPDGESSFTGMTWPGDIVSDGVMIPLTPINIGTGESTIRDRPK